MFIIVNLSGLKGAILMREWAKKLVIEGPKTKLAESQFLKRSNCHSIKMNQMKQYFVLS